MITNHGRATNVLLSIDQFEQLIRQSTANFPTFDNGPGLLRELADWMDDAMIVAQRDMTIEYANRVAHALCRKPAGSLNGQPLLAVLPTVAGTLIEVNLRRTALSSEPSSADLPSPFNPDAWLHVQTFPLGECIIFMFRDITEEVSRHRLADVKSTLIDAMNCHGDIAYVRTSVRGTIERVDQPLCKMLQLPEERLMNLPIFDLVARNDRSKFRRVFDNVIRTGESERLSAQFVSNKGDTPTCNMAIAPLHGAYGAEGAVLLMTSLDG